MNLPTRLSASFFAFWVLGACCWALAQERSLPAKSGEKIVKPFRQTVKIGADDALFTLVATLDTLPQQKLDAKGLIFHVEIFNPTKQDVSVQYLFDQMYIQLRNKEGVSLYLPEVERRLGGGIRHHAGPPKETIPKLVTPFNILSVALNERVLTREEIESTTTSLPVGSRLKADIAIDKVRALDKPNPQKPDDTAKNNAVPLPSGIYSIRVRLLLIKTGDLKFQTVFHIGSPLADEVSVNYGQEIPKQKK